MIDLRCPLCSQPFLSNPQGLACANRHQFDRAKEGYFNLLPVQNKHSLEPGDAKEQLQARRLFLNAGFFASLKTKLQELSPSAASAILDIGCGEGYFTDGFLEASPNAQVYGIDIAKTGIRLAAKSAKNKSGLTFCVASSFDLPFFNDSMDLITRIYAPAKDSELWRVLKPDGKLIIVTPGERHLLHLRSRIYKEVRPHQPAIAPSGFKLADQYQITQTLHVSEPEVAAALLTMTPFAWRLTPELRQQILAGDIHDTMDFIISVYSKVI